MSITTSPQTMEIAQAVFHDFSQGLASGEWTSFLARLSKDFTFWLPAGPFKGQNIGKDRAQDFLKMVSKLFPEGLSLRVERVMSEGNTVLFEVRSRSVSIGESHGRSQPGVHCAVIAAKNIEQREENVRAVKSFQMLDAAALPEIEQRTANVWQDNTFFRAWT